MGRAVKQPTPRDPNCVTANLLPSARGSQRRSRSTGRPSDLRNQEFLPNGRNCVFIVGLKGSTRRWEKNAHRNLGHRNNGGRFGRRVAASGTPNCSYGTLSRKG